MRRDGLEAQAQDERGEGCQWAAVRADSTIGSSRPAIPGNARMSFCTTHAPISAAMTTSAARSQASFGVRLGARRSGRARPAMSGTANHSVARPNIRRASASDDTPPDRSTPIVKVSTAAKPAAASSTPRTTMAMTSAADGRERVAAGVDDREDAERDAGERRDQRCRAEDRAQVRGVGDNARDQRQATAEDHGDPGGDRIDRGGPGPHPGPRHVPDRDRPVAGAEEDVVDAPVLVARPWPGRRAGRRPRGASRGVPRRLPALPSGASTSSVNAATRIPMIVPGSDRGS